MRKNLWSSQMTRKEEKHTHMAEHTTQSHFAYRFNRNETW